MSVTFDPQRLQALVMTHAHAKYQDQRSVGSKDRAEMDGFSNVNVLKLTYYSNNNHHFMAIIQVNLH